MITIKTRPYVLTDAGREAKGARLGYFDWTAEKDAELTRHWEMGLSGTEIGALMGVSKNAVVGRARRINLPMRKASKAERNQRAELVARRAAAEHFDPRNGQKYIGVFPPNGFCLYGIGNPKEEGFRFCGEPVARNAAGIAKPYCAAHARICFTKDSRDHADLTPEERERRRLHGLRVKAGHERAARQRAVNA